MLINKINLTIVIIGLVGAGLYLSYATFFSNASDKVFGQSPSLLSTGSSSATILITKDLTNSYTISSGFSQIGNFETKYAILGNIDTLKKEQNLIISTITKDFDNSPIVGYVKISSANNQQNSPTLANPFADKATINQKIGTELNNALTSTSKLNTAKSSIQCNFGMSISQWTCKSQGLVG
jgi:hypothetical protein